MEVFMKINIVGRQLSVYDDTKAMILEKLSKLDKYFGDDCEATATLSTKRNLKCLEITINAYGTIFRSESEDETFRNALDKTIYSIERQIRKNKTRLSKRLRSGAFDAGIIDTGEDYEEDREFVIRRKSFYFKPMSVEEAIMQMNLLDHEFFVFRDSSTEEVCVVYRRKDGDYGLITPSDNDF